LATKSQEEGNFEQPRQPCDTGDRQSNVVSLRITIGTAAKYEKKIFFFFRVALHKETKN